MLKKYSRRNRKSSKYNKRILRSESRKFQFNWGGVLHFLKSTGVFIVLLAVIALVGYYLYNIYTVSAVKSPCSGCNIAFGDSSDVENTLFIFEAPEEGSIIGAWLVTNNKESGKMVVIHIPGGVYINDYTKTLNSYIQTSNIKYVGSLVSPTKPTQYQLWELTNTLGIQISNYVIVTPKSFSAYSQSNGIILDPESIVFASLYTTEPTAEALYFNSFLDKYNLLTSFIRFNGWKTFVENLDTNLSQPELVSLLNLLKAKMSNGNIDIIDLGKDEYLTQYMDSKLDRQIPVVNLNALDQSINKYIETISPRKVSTELAKVEVYNASTLNGLAYRYARKVGNSGINVTRFENSPKNYNETIIYVPKTEGFKNSLALLEKVVGGKYSVVNARPDFITTGDIIIILGNDRSTDNTNF